MLITKKTDYAIRAFCYMAKEGKITPVTELVDNLKIPKPFLRGILQELEKIKWSNLLREEVEDLNWQNHRIKYF